MKMFGLILKNLWRNKIRTVLTALAIFTLVAIFSIIYSVVGFLDKQMAQKSRDVKLTVTERYKVRSQFDRSLMDKVTKSPYEPHDKLVRVPGFHDEQSATWTFLPMTLDPAMKDFNQFLFAIATQPDKIPTMVDDLEGFDAKLVERMVGPPAGGGPENSGILMGPDRLKTLGRKVGDTLVAKSVAYKDKQNKPFDVTMVIVGELPGQSRWSNAAFMNYDYLNQVLQAQGSVAADKVSFGWLMVDDQPAAKETTGIISADKSLGKEVKVEEASSGVSRFIEPFKDLLRGVKYLLLPAIVIVMTVIIANAISITVRERAREIGVLKILGFGRGRILALILGEGLLLGVVAGALSGLATVVLIDYVLGGIKVPIGFFSAFFVPWHAVWWGALLGGGTAFVGGILPTWNGVSAKVSEIFAKVA